MEPALDDEQKVIAKARRHWTLVGVFGFGLTMFVATTVLDSHHGPGLFVFKSPGLSTILFNLVLWLALGYVWSLGMWRYDRKRLRKSPPS
jgi:hypothetical protein